MAGYLAQAGAFTVAGAALSIYSLRQDLKRPYPTPPGTPLVTSNKRLRKSFSLRSKMVKFRRRRFRRFQRRRRFRKKVPFRRRRFTKAVRRVILKTTESKLRRVPESGSLNLAQGDGTSRVTYVQAPANSLIQGPESDEFLGSKFWLKGISLRGQVGTSGETTTYNGCLIRVTLVWSKEQGTGLDTAFVAFTSATTSIAAPLQTPPFQNPRFFETTNATNQFVGNGWALAFDRTKVKVIKSYTIQVNPGVENEAGAGIIATPTPFNLYFPINRPMQIEDPAQGDLTSPFMFKHGTYYLVMQAIANTNDVSSTQVAEMTYTTTTYFKEL